MVLQIVELDLIEQQLGGDALQSLLATMGACPLSCASLPWAQPLSEQLPLTLGSEVAGRSSWQHLRSLSLPHTGVASFVNEAALLLGQLTALQLVHAAALPEDHRVLGSGGAARIRATLHLKAPVSLANALVSCTQLTHLCLRRMAAVGSALQRKRKDSLVMIRHRGDDLPEFGRVAEFVLHRPPGTQEMHESQVKLEHIFRAEWFPVVKEAVHGVRCPAVESLPVHSTWGNLWRATEIFTTRTGFAPCRNSMAGKQRDSDVVTRKY